MSSYIQSTKIDDNSKIESQPITGGNQLTANLSHNISGYGLNNLRDKNISS